MHHWRGGTPLILNGTERTRIVTNTFVDSGTCESERSVADRVAPGRRRAVRTRAWRSGTTSSKRCTSSEARRVPRSSRETCSPCARRGRRDSARSSPIRCSSTGRVTGSRAGARHAVPARIGRRHLPWHWTARGGRSRRTSARTTDRSASVGLPGPCERGYLTAMYDFVSSRNFSRRILQSGNRRCISSCERSRTSSRNSSRRSASGLVTKAHTVKRRSCAEGASGDSG